MKWLIILCNLIIFSFGVSRADSEEHVESCAVQLMIQDTRESNCTDKIMENNASFNELITTLAAYSGDEASIRALADKNCPIFEEFLQCSVLSSEIDEECITTYIREARQLDYDLPKALLNYACGNNATSVLRLLENDGFATIHLNQKALGCLKLVDPDNKIGEDRTQGPNIIELCNGLDRVHECYTNLVKDHDNKNLVPMANEVHVLMRQTVKCPTVKSEN